MLTNTFGWRCESETRVPSSRGLVKQYNQELCISLIDDKHDDWRWKRLPITTIPLSLLRALHFNVFKLIADRCRPVVDPRPQYIRHTMVGSKMESSGTLSHCKCISMIKCYPMEESGPWPCFVFVIYVTDIDENEILPQIYVALYWDATFRIQQIPTYILYLEVLSA